MDRHMILAITPLAIALLSIVGAVVVVVAPVGPAEMREKVATVLATTGLGGACGLAQSDNQGPNRK